MGDMDETGTIAKVSKSAYSNSCSNSNSHSRKSRSTKSTHSESRSSGSSGYGGKPTSSSSNDQTPEPSEKRAKDKESKIRKRSSEQTVIETLIEEESGASSEPAAEAKENAQPVAPPAQPVQAKAAVELDDKMSITPETSVEKEEVKLGSEAILGKVVSSDAPVLNQLISACSPLVQAAPDGFWCVISMNDGVVMYTTNSITSTLGYPKDLWLGRSFIDFIHPRDRSTFDSQITSGIAAPDHVKEADEVPKDPISSMFCRIRRYRGLVSGFGIKEKTVFFAPFLLKLSFKFMRDDNGKTMYLFTQATPFVSYFKVANEVVTKACPFVLRHSALGLLEHVSPESVPFLGYFPQDLTDKDALQLYHPDDLPYLTTVYEAIVRDGSAPRCKPYRMLSHNGQYVKLESEWTSFINPWSRKLEFVTGKHFTIEGPTNPDVFQLPDPNQINKMTESERIKAQNLRHSILKVINEMLTKPAEVANQQMSKRCQDLASFMDSLLAEESQTDGQLGILDENNHFEHDSVLLGGISPHYEYTGESHSDTPPLSYTQLNYNENLARYFDCYEAGAEAKQFQTANGDAMPEAMTGSPMNARICPVETSGDSGDATSSGESAAPEPDGTLLRLSETLITKHNEEMEKELMKRHREPRFICRGQRDRTMKENRQKKKEHLARCNASFQPTTAGEPTLQTDERPVLDPAHGVKRASCYETGPGRQKHHCTSRQLRQHTPPCPPCVEPTPPWGMQYPVGMNPFSLNGRIPQIPVMGSVATVPGVIPMYYVPTAGVAGQPHIQQQPQPHHLQQLQLQQYQSPQIQQLQHTQIQEQILQYPQYGQPPQYQSYHQPQANPAPYQTPQVQYMVYPQPVFSAPMVYSPVARQMSFPVPQTLVQQTTLHPPPPPPPPPRAPAPPPAASNAGKAQDSERRERVQARHALPEYPSLLHSPTASMQRCSETVTEETPEGADRTDESSHSSFYSSSFYKTESGSTDEDNNKANKKFQQPQQPALTPPKLGTYEPFQFKNLLRRTMLAPWKEEVCVTSELIYKYQVTSRNMDEVLQADQQRIKTLQQPPLVNEQLGQLYLDLQLEGVAARLTLEEGITSSGSSGEETSGSSQTKHKLSAKAQFKKREYSKLAMIYEEDAPLPSSPEPFDTA